MLTATTKRKNPVHGTNRSIVARPASVLCLVTAAAAGIVLMAAGCSSGSARHTPESPMPKGSMPKIPARTTGYLIGISCTSPSACTAVGHYGKAAAGTGMAIGYYSRGASVVPVTESRHGTSWTVRPSPGPAGATGKVLADVSCTSARACTAVGSYTKTPGSTPSLSTPGTLPLAQTCDGTTRTLQPLRHPAGATGSHLTGVSCP